MACVLSMPGSFRTLIICIDAKGARLTIQDKSCFRALITCIGTKDWKVLNQNIGHFGTLRFYIVAKVSYWHPSELFYFRTSIACINTKAEQRVNIKNKELSI